jgi:hypothetical protein
MAQVYHYSVAVAEVLQKMPESLYTDTPVAFFLKVHISNGTDELAGCILVWLQHRNNSLTPFGPEGNPQQRGANQ